MEKELVQQLSEHARSLEEKIRRQEGDRYKTQLLRLEEDRKSKIIRLKELEDKAYSIEDCELQLKEREERAEFELKKRLLEREKLIREQADKSALDKALL